MNNKLLFTGSLLGAMGVIAGAMGAHMLHGQLSDYAMTTYNTAVLYQIFHALLIVSIAKYYQQAPTRLLFLSGFVASAGVVLFSGSLYLIATQNLFFHTEFKWLGPITPVGGLLLVCAWSLLAIHALKIKTNTIPKTNAGV